jgi:enoyl-CoA hydratase/carnithine racemase
VKCNKREVTKVAYQDIRFEVQDGVAIITLHRPEHFNTYSGRMGLELGEAYRACDQDDAIRAVVLTGAGKAFCAGADMSMGDNTFAKQDEQTFSAAGVMPPAWEVRKPVIAAINGHAIGIGLTLALQCDMRIIANEGKYSIVQVRRGVMPDGYSHWTLPRLIGLERAAYILLTGRTISGVEAVQLGIALKSLLAAEVLPAALEIARDIAANTAPLSVAVSKRLLWESPNLSSAEVGRRETELHHHLMGKPDAIEGVMAWMERRPPQWTLSVKNDWPDWPT